MTFSIEIHFVGDEKRDTWCAVFLFNHPGIPKDLLEKWKQFLVLL